MICTSLSILALFIVTNNQRIAVERLLYRQKKTGRMAGEDGAKTARSIEQAVFWHAQQDSNL